jgi:hypothetical protein
VLRRRRHNQEAQVADRFPGPKYNRLIERDPMIVKVNEENPEFGARPSAMPKNIKNEMSIKHIESK